VTRSAPDDRATKALLDRVRADALVTRRDYLRILVTVSGGLVLGAGGVALGVFRRHGSGSAPQVKVADSIAEGEAVGFRYPGADDRAIAIRLPGGELVGYSAVCTHLSCAVLWRAEEGELHCPCHDGVFDPRTGGVLAGPPPRPLPRVVLEMTSDGVFAVGTRDPD
jgi:Rieske Fe-S protein